MARHFMRSWKPLLRARKRMLVKCHALCRVCVYSFACTCPDSLIMSTICKHIHLVKRTIMNESLDQPNDAPEHTPTDSGQPSLDEIENILTCIRSKTDDVNTLKRRIQRHTSSNHGRDEWLRQLSCP